MNKFACVSTLVLGALASAPALGAITNGGFAAGLTGWSASGNVAVDSTSVFGPPAPPAAAQAVMGTAESTGFLFGGAVVSTATLESFAGIAPGSLGATATVGSALKQSFTANAGDVLRFNYNFMTDEPQNSPSDDYAFLVVDGALQKLVSVKSAVLQGSSPSPLLDQTGYKSFLSSFGLAAGAHSVVFGIVDVPDTFGASVLAVTNVALTPVPEPSSLVLLLAGLGVVGLMRVRPS